jgi:hypothetical protein
MSFWNGKEWVADTPPAPKRPSRVRRIAAATLEATLITALTFGLIASTAFAARGGNGSRGGGTSYSGTIALAPLVVDANSNGLPNRGDVVTFDITSTSGAPYVLLECYQGTRLVLSGRKGYFESSLDTNRNFGLASGLWASGTDADCTASLAAYTKRGWSRYASTSFHVDP